MKPHKFFERYLDNDLEQLVKDLNDRYNKIESLNIKGITPVKEGEPWESSKSISTVKWREYNVFQFYTSEIYDLYLSVRDMVQEACEYYDLDFKNEKFMLQGWFNINYAKKGKLDWHDHGPHGAPNFHGYYCVNAEPSQTYYNVFGNEIINNNKNNRAILSEMGHHHAMADWDWDGPRITIAYDIIPLRDLMKFNEGNEQHWIPLC